MLTEKKFTKYLHERSGHLLVINLLSDNKLDFDIVDMSKSRSKGKKG